MHIGCNMTSKGAKSSKSLTVTISCSNNCKISGARLHPFPWWQTWVVPLDPYLWCMQMHSPICTTHSLVFLSMMIKLHMTIFHNPTIGFSFFKHSCSKPMFSCCMVWEKNMYVLHCNNVEGSLGHLTPQDNVSGWQIFLDRHSCAFVGCIGKDALCQWLHDKGYLTHTFINQSCHLIGCHRCLSFPNVVCFLANANCQNRLQLFAIAVLVQQLNWLHEHSGGSYQMVMAFGIVIMVPVIFSLVFQLMK